jgi:RNA recognition motif-containing protein
MNKLYIGNLPYEATDEGLTEHFSQAGSVTSVSIIKDKFSGRSRGFGFVEMSSDEEAQKAIETLDGQDFSGRSLKVNISAPKA